jgi:hypothetical protein
MIREGVWGVIVANSGEGGHRSYCKGRFAVPDDGYADAGIKMEYSEAIT